MAFNHELKILVKTFRSLVLDSEFQLFWMDPESALKFKGS